ncbi:MAG TPA: peptidase M22 [Opitutus sp.]|nr:peptidase M22 [Opitutus sp.]
MPSLREILAAHSPLLLLDAASARVQVGWLTAEFASDRVVPFTARWQTSDDEAGVALFRCLEILDANPADARAFIFCDGPGSILGCRTAAMAIRAWSVLESRAVFAYHSLALVAHALARPNLTVISDARRDAWHCVSLASTLRRAPAAELAGELVMPDGLRHWAPLPPNVTRVPYSLADLLPRAFDADLFRRTDSPDAFLHEEPSYATWTPQIHRAP